QGKYTEAEEKYNEALLLEVPGQTKFHAILGIANCYSNQGKYTEAEEKFNETLFFEEVPDSEKVFAHYNLGSMYERGKDYAKAKNEFETVLVLGKDINTPKQKKLLGNTHFHLGCIYRVLNKLKQAKSEFENCLKLNPDHKKAKEIATTLNEGERNG
ncbi:tetratricopeptide repeat protein, partial [bacterium]|nr:tetratricopeptide repeat protein [bacterium]